jgi:hypothetical protein
VGALVDFELSDTFDQLAAERRQESGSSKVLYCLHAYLLHDARLLTACYRAPLSLPPPHHT